MHTILLQMSGGGAGAMNIFFIGALFIVFYFFLIRPQAKKQKAQTKFETELEKGSEVVTASGILGKINKIEGNIITLEVGTKTYIRVTKSAISREMSDAVYSAKDETKK